MPDLGRRDIASWATATMRAAGLCALLAFAPALAADAPAAPGAARPTGLGPLHNMLVFHRGPSWIDGKPYTQQPLLEHAKYLQALYDRHVLIFAGPFIDNEGGVVLIDCPDEDAAKVIAADEPATRAGVFVCEIHPVRYAFDQAEGRSIWPSPKP